MEREPLEHALRCWEAELENARRIAGRNTLIVGLPAGLLAFIGLSRDEVAKLLMVVREWDTQHPEHLAPAAFGVLFLLAGSGCLFASIGMAVGVRRHIPKRPALASQLLHPLRRSEIARLAAASDAAARVRAFALTLRAAKAQLRLNREDEARLYDAVGWLVIGMALSLLSMIAYAWSMP